MVQGVYCQKYKWFRGCIDRIVICVEGGKLMCYVWGGGGGGGAVLSELCLVSRGYK